jgi:hypothetical protein
MGMLKDIDMFGFNVKMHFNKNGSEHNTTLGGICSIIFYLLVLGIFAIAFMPQDPIYLNSEIAFDSSKSSMITDGQRVGMFVMIY